MMDEYTSDRLLGSNAVVRITVRVQWVEATLACSLLAGVWNANVFRGR
jgi:hypothetical protein